MTTPPKKGKRWLVQQFIVTVENTLFGNVNKYSWKNVSNLCLTRGEAYYNMGILEKSDKFIGALNTYKIVCIGY